MSEEIPVITPIYTPFDATEVRPLLTANLDAAVADVLASVPLDHKTALVGVATGDGGRVAVLFRPYENLSFIGYLGKPWYGSLDYGVKLIASW